MRRYWWYLDGGLVALTIVVLLMYRESVLTARARELASDLQLMGGQVYFPPSLLDCLREYCESGDLACHADTTVLLGDAIDGDWLRNHRYLADLSVNRLDVYADKVDAAAIAQLIDIHPIKSIGGHWTTGTDAIAEALATESTLQAVFLNNSDLTDAGFRRLPLEQLESLDIDATHVTPTGLADLRRCGQLATLSIGRSQFTEAVAETVASLPRIERLYVHDTTTDEIVPLLSRCQNLKFLHLTSSALTKTGIESLDTALPGCVIDIDTMDIY